MENENTDKEFEQLSETLKHGIRDFMSKSSEMKLSKEGILELLTWMIDIAREVGSENGKTIDEEKWNKLKEEMKTEFEAQAEGKDFSSGMMDGVILGFIKKALGGQIKTMLRNAQPKK